MTVGELRTVLDICKDDVPVKFGVDDINFDIEVAHTIGTLILHAKDLGTDYGVVFAQIGVDPD